MSPPKPKKLTPKLTAGRKPVTLATAKWRGQKVRLYKKPDSIWMLRCRSKDLTVHCSLETKDLKEALAAVKPKLDELAETHGGRIIVAKKKYGGGTLEDVIRIYQSTPKRAGKVTEYENVTALKRIVKLALGKECHQVGPDVLPDLWPAYSALRQGLPQPDYATRRSANYGINSAVNQARGLFIPRLLAHYRKAGIIIPSDATIATRLPIIKLRRPPAKDAELIAAWELLRETDVPMWAAVGLGRFGGLRLEEIRFCKGSWIIEIDGRFAVELRDREEEGWLNKTGDDYPSFVIHPALVEYLLNLRQDEFAVSNRSSNFMLREVQAWLRPFVGIAKKPLHRLRGLYADHLKKLTEDALRISMAGDLAASRGLGHKDVGVTQRNYLTNAPILPPS